MNYGVLENLSPNYAVVLEAGICSLDLKFYSESPNVHFVYF
ncbi:hypothetical protein T4B_6995 [Trichinella pseudospiralis]|uniref:Uncharacterized protein n=1 Tax=Trichinella pseudospiralis TaxID=6337 RepID=A0A0V1GMV4_TRIPS|nr:hypothetical protein T4B_6995 [Trichinella pseudospiralis]